MPHSRPSGLHTKKSKTSSSSTLSTEEQGKWRRGAELVAVPISIAVAYLVADRIASGPILLATVPAGTRESLFVSLSATAGALLGFAITGLTVLLTLGSGPRMDWLKSKPNFREEVRRLFITAIASLGVATVVFLFLLIVATDKGGLWVGWGCLTAALVALIVERVWRLVAFFNKLMPLALKDSEGKRLPNPPMEGSPDA